MTEVKCQRFVPDDLFLRTADGPCRKTPAAGRWSPHGLVSIFGDFSKIETENLPKFADGRRWQLGARCPNYQRSGHLGQESLPEAFCIKRSPGPAGTTNDLAISGTILGPEPFPGAFSRALARPPIASPTRARFPARSLLHQAFSETGGDHQPSGHLGHDSLPGAFS